jgi:hypothetical protein
MFITRKNGYDVITCLMCRSCHNIHNHHHWILFYAAWIQYISHPVSLRLTFKLILLSVSMSLSFNFYNYDSVCICYVPMLPTYSARRVLPDSITGKPMVKSHTWWNTKFFIMTPPPPPLCMALQLYRPSPLLFSSLILYTVGRTPWTGDLPVARPLPTQTTTRTQNKRTQTSMPWVGF